MLKMKTALRWSTACHVTRISHDSKMEASIICFSLMTLMFTILLLQVKGERKFEIDYTKNTFLKDGAPFRYVSGSFHYSRVHPDNWKDRLTKVRAAGLNAVQGYVPWNVHELSPGEFTWDGASDLGQFLTLAQESDLFVLLRLGPYICGEWEFGGFPAWLLTENPNMVFRTSDPSFLKWVDKWYTELLNKIKPFMYNNGGPVLMVQIENEYGSYYACDRTYLYFLRDKVWSILGNSTVIYTTDGDGDGYLKCGKVNGTYATVDFGVTYDPAGAFHSQRDYEPHGPLVNSEFYLGWLDHWGSPHSTGDITSVSKSLDLLLNYGANINMYMFVGGTNFGFNSGANGPPFQPVPTSYDYDAPISEAGDITLKYFALRDVISKYLPLPHVPIPANSNKTKYGKIHMEFVSTIQDALPYLSPDGPVYTLYPVSMEKINFYYGFILYRFVLRKDYRKPTVLNVPGVRDRAVVMVNAVPFGIVDRDGSVSLNITGTSGQEVDILVENQGRINYGTAVNNNTKGIVKNVTLGGEIVTNWEMYPIHLEYISSLLVSKLKPSHRKSLKAANGKMITPSIYVGDVNIPESPFQPQDTFLDPQNWGKGQAIVNNFNIGRYWPSKGPQVTLYIPQPLFNKPPAINKIYLFELESSPCFGSTSQNNCSIKLTNTPKLDGPNGPGLKNELPLWYNDPRFHLVH